MAELDLKYDTETGHMVAKTEHQWVFIGPTQPPDIGPAIWFETNLEMTWVRKVHINTGVAP